MLTFCRLFPGEICKASLLKLIYVYTYTIQPRDLEEHPAFENEHSGGYHDRNIQEPAGQQPTESLASIELRTYAGEYSEVGGGGFLEFFTVF